MSRTLPIALLCGLLATTAIPTASAVEVASDINVQRSYNMPKFMIGASLGSADGDTSFSVYGGLGILQSMAFEFGYIDFGETSDNADVTAAYIDLVGKKRLSTMFSFFGKLGLGFWDYSPKVGDGDSGADIKWGLGAEWRLTSSMNVRMGTDFYAMTPDDINVFYLGMNFSF